jgi:hypothetical protein
MCSRHHVVRAVLRAALAVAAAGRGCGQCCIWHRWHTHFPIVFHPPRIGNEGSAARATCAVVATDVALCLFCAPEGG